MEVKEIWDTFNEELKQYVMRKVQDKSMTDDIVQEIFEKVIKNIKRINNVENIQEYLYKIARNTVIDSFRSRKLVLQGEFVDHSLLEENYQTITLDNSEPHETLNTIISKCCIKPFIEKLPEKYREAMISSEINNENQKDLAKRLEISYSGAKSRVQRSREKLKDLLQACCNFEHDAYGNLIQSTSENCTC